MVPAPVLLGQDDMIMCRCCIFLLFAVTLATPATAQTPPSQNELRIYTGLHAAAAKGDAGEIEKLIAAGEKPNAQDANSRTPLHVAVFFGHQAAARALLRLGANPNALDAQKYDVVTIASVHNDVRMLKLCWKVARARRTSPVRMTARR
jgi:ankyrin repeat protein